MRDEPENAPRSAWISSLGSCLNRWCGCVHPKKRDQDLILRHKFLNSRTRLDVAVKIQAARQLWRLLCWPSQDASRYTFDPVYDPLRTIIHDDQLKMIEAQVVNETYIGGSNNIIAVVTTQAVPGGCRSSSPMPHNKVRIETKRCVHHDLHQKKLTNV